MIPPEQSKKVKEQLIQQIESTFPEDKKAAAIKQIQEMNETQLEEFLIKNNLIKSDGTPTQETPQKCIFCSIVFGDIPSTKIDENEKAIAILEINPISKAHTIIIPKEHIETAEKIPKEAYELAEQTAQKITSKFNPKDVQISTANLFGHEIINVLPIYTNETLESPKNQSKPEELQELQKILSKQSPEIKIEETPEEKIQDIKEINEKNTWLPKRIP